MQQQDFSFFNLSNSCLLLPRVIRLKDAPRYLGMCRDEFNKSVRPYVSSFPIGKQGVGFDRLELDAWLVHYMHRNKRPAVKTLLGGDLWDANEAQGLHGEAISGISINASKDMAAFVKALEQATLVKQNGI